MSTREILNEELESVEIAIMDRERELRSLERKREELINRLRCDDTADTQTQEDL
jgi:hypothetical protein